MRRARTVLFVIASLALSPAIARAQSAVEVSAARDHFHAGQTHFEHQRFAEALEHFQSSLSALESPNTMLYIARCERELGRRARAYRMFDRAARDADIRRSAESRYEETFRTASGERDALIPQLGFVVLRPTSIAVISPPIVTIGGRMEDDTAWGVPIAIDPGAVDLEVRAEGHTARRRMTFVAGGTDTWAVEFGASSTPGVRPTWTPARIVAIGVGGVGVLTVVAGAITGAVVQSRWDSLVAACGSAPCPPEMQGQVAEGMALETATNLLIGAGLTLAIGGGLGILLVPSAPPGSTPRAGLAPTRDGWVLSFTGTF